MAGRSSVRAVRVSILAGKTSEKERGKENGDLGV